MAGLAEADFYGNLNPMLDSLHAPSVPVQTFVAPSVPVQPIVGTTRVSILNIR